MPRKCTICGNPQREAIETALGNKSPFRAICRQWGGAAMQ